MNKYFISLGARIYKWLKSCYHLTEYKKFRSKYSIHKSFKFNGDGIIFYGDGELVILANSYIGHGSSIQIEKGCKVNIGRNCSISHNVRIYTSSNLPDQDFLLESPKLKKNGNVEIGDGCWIGANVFINPGVKIGSNSVVGANSVVTKDIPDNHIAGGVPARILRSKNYD